VKQARKTAAPNKVLASTRDVWSNKHGRTPVDETAISIFTNRGMRNVLFPIPVFGRRAHNVVLADHSTLRRYLQSPEGQQQSAEFGREHAFVKVGFGGKIIGTNRPSVFDGHQLVPVNPELVRRLGYEDRANKAVAVQDMAAEQTRAWVEPMNKRYEAKRAAARARRDQRLGDQLAKEPGSLFNPEANRALARVRK
jgi:hypothetical protein